MAAKSPTASVRSREIIGVEQFSQRREVFDKHDTVFLPLPSPTTPTPAYKEVEPIVTSNHGKTTSNFKRNIPAYSSMRETRSEEQNHFDFRPRKYSDNFTSEINQSDDADYRYSMTDRTRRLSKLRRDFLKSNLHEPNESPQFTRAGVRASMPTNSASVVKYKIESPNLYKFPFAEPYSTPTPVRRIVVDLGSPEINGKENQDPVTKNRHQSLPDQGSSKVDHQKLFEELVKRYSPQRKPVDWTIPPTRPKVVASVPKSFSSATESVDSADLKILNEKISSETDDVFENKGANGNPSTPRDDKEIPTSNINSKNVLQNGPEIITDNDIKDEKEKRNDRTNGELTTENESKTSLTELAEKNDSVPELSTIQHQLNRENKEPLETITDLTIPKLIEQMSSKGDKIENNTSKGKKVKRKRSFLDKLLGRNKEK